MRYHVELIPVIPLLILPFWTDCYHSVLLHQVHDNNDGTIHPFQAIGETFRLLPSFILEKLGLYVIAFLWGLIPLLGWYKDYRYRIKWAMISNILVFEQSPEPSALKRCDELADLVIMKERSHALWAIPSSFYFFILLFLMLGTTLFATSLFLWISILLSIYIFLPCSATVNTLVYISISDHLSLDRLEKKPRAI